MFDRSAIEKIQELITAADEDMADLGVIALPEKTTIYDLEQFQDRPRRHRRRFVTDDVNSFVDYVNASADDVAVTMVFVGERSVRAIIGASTEDAPRWEDHTAELTIKDTPIYKALLQLQNTGKHSQKALADWLTEWAESIDCGIDAENGDVPVGQAIAAIRRMTVDVKLDSEHSVEEYQASRSAMESVEVNDARGKIIGFKLSQPLFIGFDPVEITVRLTVYPDRDSGPRFQAKILRYEDLVLKQREIVAGTIREHLPDDVAVFVGEVK